jgi:hypothetical protein
MAAGRHGRVAKLRAMDRVEEIEAAIARLPMGEYLRLIEWFRTREAASWDDQINQDSASGKLDLLFAEAESETQQGLVRDWPIMK